MPRVWLPVIWHDTGEKSLVLYVNVSGQTNRQPGEDGVIRIGSIHFMTDGTFTVWSSCAHSINGPPASFATLPEAQRAFLAAIGTP